MGKIENLVVILYGENNYYGLNIINSLLKNNLIPKAILIEKTKSGSFNEAKMQFEKAYKKKGLAGCAEKFSRNSIGFFIFLGLIKGWSSQETYKLAKPDLKFFEFGLKLNNLCLEEKGIEIVYCENNSPETINYCNQNNIEIIIGSPTIIKKETLHKTKGKFVNAHPAFLPYIRGRHSEVWSILYGLNLGATLHFMDQGIDTGKIIGRSFFPFEEYDTWGTLRLKGKDHCIRLYLKHLKDLCFGEIKYDDLAFQDISIGKKTFGVNFFDYYRCRRNFQFLKKMIHDRKSIGLPDPGNFYTYKNHIGSDLE